MFIIQLLGHCITLYALYPSLVNLTEIGEWLESDIIAE